MEEHGGVFCGKDLWQIDTNSSMLQCCWKGVKFPSWSGAPSWHYWISLKFPTKHWVASCVCPTSQHDICRNHRALWLYAVVLDKIRSSSYTLKCQICTVSESAPPWWHLSGHKQARIDRTDSNKPVACQSTLGRQESMFDISVQIFVLHSFPPANVRFLHISVQSSLCLPSGLPIGHLRWNGQTLTMSMTTWQLKCTVLKSQGIKMNDGQFTADTLYTLYTSYKFSALASFTKGEGFQVEQCLGSTEELPTAHHHRPKSNFHTQQTGKSQLAPEPTVPARIFRIHLNTHPEKDRIMWSSVFNGTHTTRPNHTEKWTHQQKTSENIKTKNNCTHLDPFDSFDSFDILWSKVQNGVDNDHPCDHRLHKE